MEFNHPLLQATSWACTNTPTWRQPTLFSYCPTTLSVLEAVQKTFVFSLVTSTRPFWPHELHRADWRCRQHGGWCGSNVICGCTTTRHWWRPCRTLTPWPFLSSSRSGCKAQSAMPVRLTLRWGAWQNCAMHWRSAVCRCWCGWAPWRRSSPIFTAKCRLPTCSATKKQAPAGLTHATNKWRHGAPPNTSFGRNLPKQAWCAGWAAALVGPNAGRRAWTLLCICCKRVLTPLHP